jgi:hypothetical protein
MNDRILELMKQADYPAPELALRAQKLAELIVRECALISDTERSNSVGCGYITKTNGMRIKEHFGVEPDVNENLRNRSTYFGNDI